MTPEHDPISVTLPNGSAIHSNSVGTLPIPGLSAEATKAYVFDSLHSPLLSIGQLCDADCTATFTKRDMVISHDDATILTGHRDASTNHLWQVDLPPAPDAPPAPDDPLHSANAALLPTKVKDLVAFSHACLNSPVPSTLEAALSANNELTVFPGLTLESFRKHTPNSEATAKAHMKQTRKNVRSTKPETPALPLLPELDEFPPPLDKGKRTHYLFASVIDRNPTGRCYGDLTGRLPLPSSRGNNYLLILYDYDSNFIAAEPIKDRTAASILAAYIKLHNVFIHAGFRPILQALDNECSDILKAYFKEEDIDYQLTPAYIHRRNAAERAIQTFKDHFIAALCGCDPEFPMYHWCSLIPQTVLTLNLLRTSRAHPHLSAWAAVHGTYDYNKHPIAPLGTHVMIHQKPSQRGTWSPPGIDAWYVGPDFERYRCFTCVTFRSRKVVHPDTLSWFPKQISMPTSTTTEVLSAAIADLTEALSLHDVSATFAPTESFSSPTLSRLNDIFLPSSKDASPDPDQASKPLAPATLLRVPPPVPDDETTPRASNRKSLPGPVPPLRRSPRLHHANMALQTPTCPAPASHCANMALPAPTYHLEMFVSLSTHQANKAINVDTGQPAEYRELLRSSEGPLWDRATAMEFGRLSDGCKTYKTTGTQAIKFIRFSDVPKDRIKDITYVKLVVADRPFKVETKRVRATAGGDRINYPFDVSSRTAELNTSKLLFNSVVSTPGACFMTLDIQDFFLSTSKMERAEFAKVPLSTFPQCIIDEYDLTSIAHNGFVYLQIDGAMYGLPQASLLANKQLVRRLGPAGFDEARHTAGLFVHKTRPLMFALIVDDFGVHFVDKANADFLISTLSQHYTLTIDWTGAEFCGLHLDWDYTARSVELSMPGYVARALARFAVTDHTPSDSPHQHVVPQYGAKVQLTTVDSSPFLDADATTRIREIVGVFLYYARAIDNTMLVALGTIASQQASATQATANAVVDLLNYAATHPDAIIKYFASDMVLYSHTDASYLSEAKARSRASGFFFLSDHPDKLNGLCPPLNGALHVLTGIMRNVLASAAEAETGSAFLNAQCAVPLRTTLHEMGWPQPATVITTDNSVARGILNDTVKQKRSKAIDMRFYWLQDRIKDGQFIIQWKPGRCNLSDYYSKHFPPSHHRLERPLRLHEPGSAKAYEEWKRLADAAGASPAAPD